MRAQSSHPVRETHACRRVLWLAGGCRWYRCDDRKIDGEVEDCLPSFRSGRRVGAGTGAKDDARVGRERGPSEQVTVQVEKTEERGERQSRPSVTHGAAKGVAHRKRSYRCVVRRPRPTSDCLWLMARAAPATRPAAKPEGCSKPTHLGEVSMDCRGE